jgi:hypothetical protein
MQNTQEMLADYFEDQARWRDEKAAEYPEDTRNAIAAESLCDLAAWVRSLPDNHPDVQAIRTLHGPGGWDLDVVAPGEEASRLTSRFGGFDARRPPEEFLHEFVDAIVAEEMAEGMADLDDDEDG